MRIVRTAARTLRRATVKHLHRRIVAVFLGLLLLVQAASFLAIRHGIEANARRDIAGGMQTGETLLRRLLAQNAEQLREAARLLATDYGFRAAVAVGDAATLTDALSNQAERIGADVAVFTDPRGKAIASTMTSAQQILAMLDADARTDLEQRGDTGLQAQDGRAYQMVTVAVKAPQLIGQVSMGFPLSASLPRDLRNLSSLGVVFLTRVPGGPWRPLRGGGRPTRSARRCSARSAPSRHRTVSTSTAIRRRCISCRSPPTASARSRRC